MATATADGSAVVCESIEMGADEADRKMRGEGWDPLAVKNKDPNFHYRWLNKNRMNLARKCDYLGYEIVNGGAEISVLNEGTPKMKKGTDVAGPVEVGDLVLARIPKARHERYRTANRDLIKRREMAVGPGVRSAIDKAAGSHVSYEEHSDNPNMRSN